MGWLVKRVFLVLIVLVGSMIILKSVDYYRLDFTKGFLVDKYQYFKSFHIYQVVFYVHLLFSSVALFVGLIQWSFPKNLLHVTLGKIYISLVLLFISPSGFVMAIYANGGIWAKLSFVLLSVLLFIITYKGFNYVKVDINKHIILMNTSFLLMTSAVFLRVYLFIFSHFFNWTDQLSYVVISWLSWLPQFLFYTIYKLRSIKLY